MGVRVSDWVGFYCGDLVQEKDNPRHIGRVEAVFHGVFIKVRWLGNNWFSIYPREDLVKVTER